jgi:16S rRNA processing protein RimM
VLVRTYTEVAEDLDRYRVLTVADSGRTLRVMRVRASAKGLIVAFDGVADRTAAEALRGAGLQVARDELPKAGEREFYHADLVGLALRQADGAAAGRVVGVANFGAGDLLEIEVAGRKGTEFIPFDDDFVPSLDLEAGFAVIDLSRLDVAGEDTAEGDEEE